MIVSTCYPLVSMLYSIFTECLETPTSLGGDLNTISALDGRIEVRTGW